MKEIMFSALAFSLTIVFIKAFYQPAIAIGLIDAPCGRKTHSGTVPLIGGLAVFSAICLSAILHGQLFDEFRLFFASLFILVSIGILDDIYTLSPRSRFLAQIIAALLMIFPGQVCLSNLGNLLGFGDIILHGFSVPFTVFCVVGVVNAINMIDGIDGLAGGVVLIVLALFGSAALITGIGSYAILIYLLASAVLAFTAFNMRLPWRPKAVVFLGDAGSTMLGFSIAWIAIFLTSQGESSLSPIAGVWIVGVPVVDTLSIILRRLLKGRSPFSADREHIHHILQHVGFSHTQTLLLILAVELAMGLTGLAGWYLGIPEYVMFYAFILVFIAYSWSIQHAWRTMKLLRTVHEHWQGQ
jgi:UDP-GlcNAc:undecaprenyl-phosphate GlcNAc-1-phosphate transferase